MSRTAPPMMRAGLLLAGGRSRDMRAAVCSQPYAANAPKRSNVVPTRQAATGTVSLQGAARSGVRRMRCEAIMLHARAI